MKYVRIIGVPEHFNFPWKMCIENGEFQQYGIDLEWEDIPEGTGRICEMLRNETTDLAIVLTEGICKDISNGNESYIVQKYIETPLQWGIHVAHESNYDSLEDLKGKKIAVSRLGSGSHLMSMVFAKQMGWDINELEYVVVQSFDNAIKVLQNGEADYFMWEQFMTQPTVDAQIFRRLGICPTPWSAFVVAVRKTFYDENIALVKQLLEIINQTTREFKQIPSIDQTLSVQFAQKVENIRQWMGITRWSQKNYSKKEFETLNQSLIEWNLLNELLSFEKVIK